MEEIIVPEREEVRNYHVLKQDGVMIRYNSLVTGTKREVRELYPSSNWAIIEENALPNNWRDMSIQNGELVPATQEVLATRQTAEYSAAIEAVRKSREEQYRNESDALLFDAIEAFAVSHPEYTEFASWLEAKEAIRAENPKPILKNTGQ